MNLVVIGAQWGDEGKGKIVDYLAKDADCVVRYSGGPNAGHTIVTGGKKFALHQVPSGILYEGKKVFLGAGMVIDPESLFAELEELSANGIDWQGRVFIADRAHLILPRYKDMDKERDLSRKRPIGTTGRGIGVAYSEKAHRDGIRLADIDWDAKLADLDNGDKAFLNAYRERLLRMRADICEAMESMEGRNVLFEGAQGAMLDLDWGTYPFVSSGASAASGAAAGGGIGPHGLDAIVGVFKAYETRVGNGPMPSEFNSFSEDELCQYVREKGHEYGVTTGRPRRCGYLDLVALRYACRVNSLDGLVLTHLDIYDQMDTIEACVGYDVEGKIVSRFPASIEVLGKAKPVLQKMGGWKKDIGGCKSYKDLPPNARAYVEFIEEFTGVPVVMISTGSEREQTIVRKNPWKK